MDENEKRNKAKLEFFFTEKVKIHVERKDKQFWNGTIISKKNDMVYLFDEFKYGVVHLFVSDIWEVEEYRTEGK